MTNRASRLSRLRAALSSSDTSRVIEAITDHTDSDLNSLPIADRIAARREILSHDICPLHLCDIEICADDDRSDCRALRS